MVHRQVSSEFASEAVAVEGDDPKVRVVELDDGGFPQLDHSPRKSHLCQISQPIVKNEPDWRNNRARIVLGRYSEKTK
jgi:hypothetical protein